MPKTATVSNEQIIAALLASGTIATAARSVGLSPRTLFTRMTQADFQASYEAAKTDLMRGAVFAMQQRLADAVRTIVDIMADKESPASVRLQAAQTIIANASRFADRLNLEERRQQGTVKFANFGEDIFLT